MWLALLLVHASSPASALDSALAKPDQVKKLNLSRQSLDTLPPDIAKLKKLHDLDLSYNALQELPAEIGELSQLESLSLRCNKLKKLPDSLSKLGKLKRLDLSNAMDCEDAFRMTPQASAIVGKLTGLSELRVAFVHLKGVPPELTKLPLKVLDISYNEIAGLPKTWPSELEELDLSGNELQKAPDFAGLKKLQKVALGGQRGKKTIPADQLDALKKQLPQVKVITD